MTKTTKILWVAGLSSAILFLSYKAYKEYKLYVELKAINEELEKEFAENDEEAEEVILDVLEDELEPLEPIFEEVEVLREEYLEDTGLLEQMLDWSTEELSEMRYDSSSSEAWEQYKLYLLSDIPSSNRVLRNAINNLHNYTMPYYKGGEFVFNSMHEDRFEFFGNDSIYTSGELDEVTFTFAEFILQVARQLSIDLDQPMVTVLSDIYHNTVDEEDDYTTVINRIVENTYYNSQNMFGILSLDTSMGQQWENRSLFDQYNTFIYDKIEYGMYAVPGKGDANNV